MNEQIQKSQIAINPPPCDGKCNICKKKAPLFKTFRADSEFTSNSDNKETKRLKKISNKFFAIHEKHKDNHEKFEKAMWYLYDKYSPDDIEKALLYDQLESSVCASWECDKCIKDEVSANWVDENIQQNNNDCQTLNY